MFLIQNLTVAHVVIHIGLHIRKLKRLQFQNFKNSMKILKNVKSAFVFLKSKAHGITEPPFAPNMYLCSMN